MRNIIKTMKEAINNWLNPKTDDVVNDVIKDKINPKIELGKSTSCLNTNFGSIKYINLGHSIDNVIGKVVKGRTVPLINRELIENIKKEVAIRNLHNELESELNSTSAKKPNKSTNKMKI